MVGTSVRGPVLVARMSVVQDARRMSVSAPVVHRMQVNVRVVHRTSGSVREEDVQVVVAAAVEVEAVMAEAVVAVAVVVTAEPRC
jgi:hypothetical protein